MRQVRHPGASAALRRSPENAPEAPPWLPHPNPGPAKQHQKKIMGQAPMTDEHSVGQTLPTSGNGV